MAAHVPGAPLRVQYFCVSLPFAHELRLMQLFCSCSVSSQSEPVIIQKLFCKTSFPNRSSFPGACGCPSATQALFCRVLRIRVACDVHPNPAALCASTLHSQPMQKPSVCASASIPHFFLCWHNLLRALGRDLLCLTILLPLCPILTKLLFRPYVQKCLHIVKTCFFQVHL